MRGFSHTAFMLALVLAWLARCGAASAQADPARPGNASSVGYAASASFSRRLAQSHFERATELERRAEFAQALREYNQSIAIDGSLGEAYLKLGALRERMGDTREAELVYSQAIRLADAAARALLQRSHLYRARGQSEQARRDLEASLELEPNRDALSELARECGMSVSHLRHVFKTTTGKTLHTFIDEIRIFRLSVDAAATPAVARDVANYAGGWLWQWILVLFITFFVLIIVGHSD